MIPTATRGLCDLNVIHFVLGHLEKQLMLLFFLRGQSRKVVTYLFSLQFPLSRLTLYGHV